ncbi:MAG: non-canonical purine NTP pyrophosphatase [Firmicutes bacterium]|nr:non-canonical purine NTP pyrophosphatase [Alicyclobacillaceae bacterium]MCL6497999.1 non-canonical purine NTP pyrophosphatase [Bacillota bacterium]
MTLASHNRGKWAEFMRLVEPFGVTLTVPEPSPSDLVEETGSTYLENARLKAVTMARTLGVWTLADDSGVEVDALGGLPGVQSARFVSDDPWENTREILLRLMEVPWPRRTARMVAVVVLAAPDGRYWWAEGRVEGRILLWPRGTRGFGVDPIFSVDGVRSLAEVDDAEKDACSHRGEAVRRLFGGHAIPGAE